jgi:hypothetical protein
VRVFVSYARVDRADLGQLTEALDLLGHRVWYDAELTGGQVWWEEILAQLRGCDAVVALLTPALLRSPACRSEVEYALALRRPVLPAALGDVDLALLPPALAALQVHRLDDTQQSAYRFAAAVAAIRPGVPLPDPLPDPPPAPTSWITVLADRVRAPVLTLDEQLALVAHLEDARDHDPDRVATLAADLANRDDLYARVSRRLDRLHAGSAPPPPPTVKVLGRKPDMLFVEFSGAALGIGITARRPIVRYGQQRLPSTDGPVTGTEGVSTFLLPLEGGGRAVAQVRWRDKGKAGIELVIDGTKVYSDGELA